MYEKSTDDISVTVEPFYVEEQSRPSDSYFFFAYKVMIKNSSSKRAQLISRKWIITDARGRTEEVRGPGVVGEQPILEPGGSYEYTSFCPLPTPTGSMRGVYQMIDQSGHRFEVTIPHFHLRILQLIH